MYLVANVIDQATHKIVISLKTLACPHLARLICDIDHLHARQIRQIVVGPYDFRDHGITDGIAELAD